MVYIKDNSIILKIDRTQPYLKERGVGKGQNSPVFPLLVLFKKDSIYLERKLKLWACVPVQEHSGAGASGHRQYPDDTHHNKGATLGEQSSCQSFKLVSNESLRWFEALPAT